MEVIAKARFIRMSPRKIRLVVNAVRGKGVDQALTQLRFLNKAAALPVSKALASAVANAEHNFQLKRDNLFVKTITADGGPMLKRWRARAFGRAAPILKRTTHISIVLAERAPSKAKPTKKQAAAVAAAPVGKQAVKKAKAT